MIAKTCYEEMIVDTRAARCGKGDFSTADGAFPAADLSPAKAGLCSIDDDLVMAEVAPKAAVRPALVTRSDPP